MIIFMILLILAAMFGFLSIIAALLIDVIIAMLIIGFGIKLVIKVWKW